MKKPRAFGDSEPLFYLPTVICRSIAQRSETAAAGMILATTDNPNRIGEQSNRPGRA
jgi:hypothetical protein